MLKKFGILLKKYVEIIKNLVIFSGWIMLALAFIFDL